MRLFGTKNIESNSQSTKDLKGNSRSQEKRLTKYISSRYIKENFFFFVGCICAILAESNPICVIIIYSTLLLSAAEVICVFFSQIWIIYIIHVLKALGNYANILIAILCCGDWIDFIIEVGH